MAAMKLHVLKPSVNNMAARVFVRAAKLDFTEDDVYGKTRSKEFLAMNPADQQRIAYWVDGYQVAKGEAAVGVVAFDKFGQPIGALVDDCKATPKETLWQKLKKYL